MYFLDFCAEKLGSAVAVEYRLACSGELYNRRVEGGDDWRRYDVTRILLRNPFSISVVSRPFDSYPQELCARAAIGFVTELGSGFPGMSGSRSFLPDKEIIEDLCSVLTLLSRRLISPVGKTREKFDDEFSKKGWHGGDAPVPTIDRPAYAMWPRRPLTIITRPSGREIKSHDPPPVGVDPFALADFIKALSTSPDAQEIVHTARIYRTALELIHERADTAYLALISVVESLANIELRDYEPDDTEKLDKYYGALQKKARAMGLDEAQVKDLVLAACKQERWLRKKFVKFCTDNCPAAEIADPDRVFPIFEPFNPKTSEMEQALGRIYKARSTNLHVAQPFPRGIAQGMAPQIDMLDLPDDPMGQLAIPPAPWFERIVSIAARRFLTRLGPAPFVEFAEDR